MKYLFKRLNYVVVILIVIIILFLYFGVFYPLKSELEDSLKDNFKNLISISELNIENYFSRCKDGAESLSSRTMIKNKLEKFHTGQLSFSQLKKYTQPKYCDGAIILENIKMATRITEDRVIATWSKKDQLSNKKNYFTNNQETKVEVDLDNDTLIINSPIIKDNIKLGHDIVTFNLSPLLNKINSNNIQYSIVYKKVLNDKFMDKNNYIVEYRRVLDTNYWLKGKMSKANLYKNLNNLTIKIIAGIIAILAFVYFIYKTVIKNTYQQVIHKLEAKVNEITKVSQTDCLLEINNRTKFMDELEREIKRAREYDTNFSLIMFDIDNFKYINDHYGHLVGDNVLNEITNIIEDEIRSTDLFARYGGDEFMIITPNIEIEDAFKLAKRLRKIIANERFEDVGKITCSFGVAEFNDDNIDSLINRVDNALYQAKGKGKNKVKKLK